MHTDPLQQLSQIAKLAVMIKTKVAIQGQEGSFHAQAAEQLFGSEIELKNYHNFSGAFKAVGSGEVDHAVVAVENSLFGPINDSYDLLAQQHAWVAGEVCLEIHHQLIGLAGAELGQITEVHSQAPALGQCREWLERHVPQARLIEEYDTAASVKMVKEWADPTKAAIASLAAAKLYKLRVLASDVEDHHRNYTRFFRLDAQRPDDLKTANKTSLSIITSHDPGSLHRALGAFAEHGINISMLHSRPIPGDAWHYTIYLDIESGLDDPNLIQALATLKAQDCSYTIFGSYPKAALPN